MTTILSTLKAAFTDPAAFRKAHAGAITALAAVALAVFPPHTWPYQLAAFIVGGSALPVIAQARNARRRAHPTDTGIVGLIVLAIVLLLVFGGLGFAWHLLWLGLVLAALAALAAFIAHNE